MFAGLRNICSELQQNNLKKKKVWKIASCNLSLILMSYFINDDESHFVPGHPQSEGLVKAGEVCTARQLIRNRTDESEECFQFPIHCWDEKAKYKKISALWFFCGLLWKIKLSPLRNVQSQASKPHSALKTANVTIWWIILFPGAWLCPSFSICVRVSVSELPTLSSIISVESKTVFYQPLSVNVTEPEVHVCVMMVFWITFGCFIRQG